MRRQIAPLLVFTAALHAPLDSEPPDVRVVTGVQYDFGASQRLSRER